MNPFVAHFPPIVHNNRRVQLCGSIKKLCSRPRHKSNKLTAYPKNIFPFGRLTWRPLSHSFVVAPLPRIHLTNSTSASRKQPVVQIQSAPSTGDHRADYRFRRQTITREQNNIIANNGENPTTGINNSSLVDFSPSKAGVAFSNNHSEYQMTTHEQSMETVGSNVLVLIVLFTAVLTSVGLLTCVITHYQHSHHHRTQTEETIDCSPSSTHHIWNQQYCSQTTSKHKFNSSTVPMLALEANMERERCALRDRQVRLHSLHTDLELDLPTSLPLPDGEETPYGSSTRLHIRDAEQQSEIYRKCIRPPPNRTIEQSEPILPYRSHSTGLLSCNSNSNSHHTSIDWGQNVVRCHSMSSRFNSAVSKPSVILPMKSQHQHQHQQVSAGLSQITMVPCLTDRCSSASRPTNFEKVHHSSTNSRNSSAASTTTTSLSSMDGNSRPTSAAPTSTVTIKFNH